ncbi:MAG TPA: hypothetical protein VEA59_04250 [Patescibacteria group bacterium]|nr:hypothetical protein [Patescibacteria group bacterium]
MMRRGQNGQTIIETMVAIFILVTGIFAVLALATDSFASTSNIKNQIIATGLVREGIEVVKNMRDTNWLNSQVSDCYNYSTTHAAPRCHQDWLRPGVSEDYGFYNIQGILKNFDNKDTTEKCADDSTSLTNIAVLAYNENFNGYSGASSQAANARFWNRNTTSPYANIRTATTLADLRLLYDPGLNTNEAASPRGYYVSLASYPANTSRSSNFYRAVCVYQLNNRRPFSQTSDGTSSTYHGPLLLVVSRVWWFDGYRCKASNPASYYFGNAASHCRIELKMYLTNWKNNS